MEFITDKSSIYHLVLGITGMNASSMNFYSSARSIEVLIFKFSKFTAVNGISKVCTKSFYIKISRSLAYFFIRSKSNTYFTVRDILLFKYFHHGHNLSDPGLIIRTEKSCSVSCNKCSSLKIL